MAACSAVMKARRCCSSGHWVNSCSNWSTTSNSRRPGFESSGSSAGPLGCARAACRTVSANPAGSASSPRRTSAASVPASCATRTASSSSGARAGVNNRHGQDADPGADASPAPRSRGSTPARSSEDLPAPDTPDTTSSPAPFSCRDIRSSTWVAAASRPKKNAASRSSNALSPRYGESITPETLASGGATTPSAQVRSP